MSVPKPSKVVRRSVALGLGIICIVLIAGLGGELAFYFLMVSDRDSTIARKDNQITLLNSEISNWNPMLRSYRAK